VNNLKRYQNIDYANGGDVRGMIRASDTYLKASNDGTKIVVGHGPLASKADVAEFRAMLVTSRERIEKLFNEGKTEAEVLALKPLADLDEKWAAGNPQLAISHTKNVARPRESGTQSYFLKRLDSRLRGNERRLVIVSLFTRLSARASARYRP
jgi:hypothetical protein